MLGYDVYLTATDWEVAVKYVVATTGEMTCGTVFRPPAYTVPRTPAVSEP